MNNSGIACLADFGLSFVRIDQTLSQPITSTTITGISCHWAAPELVQSDDLPRESMASDVWALGCICYAVLIMLSTSLYGFTHRSKGVIWKTAI